MKKIQSTCNLCALACNVDFHVENDKIVKVSPTVDYPVNKGFCCIKGLNLDKQQTKIKARKSPLLRDENGEMKEISWEEGIKTFAEKMTAIQEKYGKESVLSLVQDKCQQKIWHYLDMWEEITWELMVMVIQDYVWLHQ